MNESGTHTTPFRIVGIGASAGGLESLEALFATLPAEPGMAFVVVQHLSPDFRSMMGELLSRRSAMPVHPAEHGVAVEPNRVYLLPPRKEMTIEGGRLIVVDKDPAPGLTLPIDLFFRSLAADARSNAVAVVLSGSGSDGSRGIRDVKRSGGLVLVESPESAQFDGMPLSSLATGLVDRTGTPAEIARVLVGASDDVVGPAEHAPSETDGPETAVLRLLRAQFGLDFTLYKQGTVGRRIARRVAMRELGSLDEYVEQLRDDPEELSSLYHDLLIGVTRFFRDPDAFEVIEKKVVPGIVERVPEPEEIRVWVAGCATGEEAYSLAMLLYEELTARGREINFKILATDVHRASLERASAGLYAEEQLEHVSQRRRERFFAKHPGGLLVSPELRQHIVFAPHDVTHDAPFTKLHLVSCRNLLIYFEPDAQKAVISLFHFGLASNGVLFLGSSETTGGLSSEFDAIDDHWKIYRKRRDVRLLDPLRLPVGRKTMGVAPHLLSPVRTTSGAPQLLPIYDRLLDRFMPPGLLVEEDRTLVDSFGGAERYLRLGRRRPSRNLLELLEGDLRTVVAGAIQRALVGDGPARYSGVPARPGPNGTARLVVEAEAFSSPRTGSRYVLITLEDEAPPRRRGEVDPLLPELTSAQASDERVNVLESELAYARDTLQAAIEEQQTSNEELQATNEELIASNEELQSTNEELHSVNEELYTVNAEYQKKIGELRELNGDMQHLLEGTDIGTLFLDRALRIRRFTPRVASVFHIRPADVGRELRDFSHDLVRPTLFDDVARVLDEGIVVEDEVQDCHGTTFFLRMLPYRPATEPERERDGSTPLDPLVEPPIQGVVLSLTDISALDQARARIKELSAIVEQSDDAIIGHDLEGVVTSWNRGAERLYGYAASEAIGKRISLLTLPGDEEELTDLLAGVRRGERRESVETVRRRKDGTALDVSITVSPIHDRDAAIVGASEIARDITQLKLAQRSIEEREARIRQLLDSTAEAIIGLDPEGVCTFCNEACARMLGQPSVASIIGRRLHSLVRHARADGTLVSEHESQIHGVLRTGRAAHSADEVLHRADGSSFPAEYWCHPVRRGDVIEGAVLTFLDITERKQAEQALRLVAERREQFLAMLSHELRNPLAAVLRATHVLRTYSDDEAALERARGVVERQSAHMARLLDDLLDVARITRGGVTLRKEDVDLRESVRLAIEAIAPQLEDRRARLELQLPERPLPIRGDRARLQQIVGNLLANAVKYSPPGSPIVLSLRRDEQHAVLSVRDRGEGIAADLMPKIFDLFVQAAQGIDRADGGLGVGLALVRHLVDLHGGRVEAHSDGPGRGSEFRVVLPLQSHALLPGRDDPQRGLRGPRRIVIVEDQDDARDMLKMVLERKGHVVVEAKNGPEGVEAIERAHPDVALVDIGIPLLDGYGVARRVRENPVLDDVVLIALTGYGTDDDVSAARDAGFTEHLTKPIDLLRIDEIVSRRTP